MNRIDTSKVDRMEMRQRIANRETEREGIVAEIDTAEAPFRARIEAIEEEMAAATKPLQERLDKHDETATEDEESIYAFDEYGRPQRCCISGLVLLNDDHLIEDLQADNFALAAVLPGWPVAQELPDVADVQEKAA